MTPARASGCSPRPRVPTDALDAECHRIASERKPGGSGRWRKTLISRAGPLVSRPALAFRSRSRHLAGTHRTRRAPGRLLGRSVRLHVLASSRWRRRWKRPSPDSVDDEIDRTALPTTCGSRSTGSPPAPARDRSRFWLNHLLEGLLPPAGADDGRREHRAPAARERLEAIPGFSPWRRNLGECPTVFSIPPLDRGRGGLLLDQVGEHCARGGRRISRDPGPGPRSVDAFGRYLSDDLRRSVPGLRHRRGGHSTSGSTTSMP